MTQEIIEKLKNKKIAILGYGLEGKSSYTWIRKHLKSEMITILDGNTDLELELREQKDENLNWNLGPSYLQELSKYDVIMKSPGISLKDIPIQTFQDRITSQLELLLEAKHQNVIGITGTKGKSTTSSLLYQIGKDQNKKIVLIGNIGKPVLDVIDEIDEETIVVVEMSSHQLEYIKVSPHIAVILNLFEDHLDHAGTVEHYHESKLNIFRYQTQEDIAIYCADNEILKRKVNENYFSAHQYTFGTEASSCDVYLKDDFICCQQEPLYSITSTRNLLGKHNLKNIMVVLWISRLLGFDLKKAAISISHFQTLEHRMENIGTFDGVTYYSDTIATIPEATKEAIEAIPDIDTLIFGGKDRHIDYTHFIAYLKTGKVRNLIAMPTTGFQIAEQLVDTKTVNLYKVESLKEAVQIAHQITEKGKSCLLSPAASSYDYFKNYKEKGDCYKEFVAQLSLQQT